MALPWPLRPVAHRGLHDQRRGVIENTPAAFQAAIDTGYAIELDVQATAGEEPVVFHDDTLERLTHGSGAIGGLSVEALKAVAFRQTGERMQTLSEFLEQVAGRVPVFMEIKTVGDNAGLLCGQVAKRLAGYKGPMAVMSFDWAAVRAMQQLTPHLPQGIISMRYTAENSPELSAFARFRLTHMLDFPAARPNFLAYHVNDLPMPGVALLRRLGLPVLTWTVRSEEQRRRAAIYGDAIIFEELRP
jgi:glycerophosphoryl diester phosphodiesterase